MNDTGKSFWKRIEFFEFTRRGWHKIPSLFLPIIRVLSQISGVNGVFEDVLYILNEIEVMR